MKQVLTHKEKQIMEKRDFVVLETLDGHLMVEPRAVPVTTHSLKYRVQQRLSPSELSEDNGESCIFKQRKYEYIGICRVFKEVEK